MHSRLRVGWWELAQWAPRAIVEASMAAVLNTWHDLLVRRLEAAEFIGDEHARDVAAAFQ